MHEETNCGCDESHAAVPRNRAISCTGEPDSGMNEQQHEIVEAGHEIGGEEVYLFHSEPKAERSV